MTTPQEQWAQIGQESAKLIQEFSEKQGLNTTNLAMTNLNVVSKAFTQLAETMMRDPQRLVQMQLDLYQRHLSLWANMAERMMGKPAAPVVEPEKGDRRFKDEDWQNNLLFDFIKQSYLLTSNWMMDGVRSHKRDLDPKTAEKVEFYTRQFVDALAPTNFPLTNPEVLKKTVETNGQNLVQGLKNLLADMEKGKITLTDTSAFEVGKNIAVTEGQVVYQNRLIQLIQYTPKTKDVYKRPLLILPPWINKFYILDMRPENSFIRYAVEEAQQTTFIVSWKNPTAEYKDVGFAEYMKEGALEAIEKVLEITGEKDLNIIGYCIGGTLTAATLAWMAKKHDKRVNSATFFTTLMDFSEAGELGVFIDDEQVTELERKMSEAGYLDGKEMAATFSMLRENDLIWSFVVNNYLLGQQPFPFDLLYWNDDSTRMPCAMHSYYLRNMYIENNLVKKNKLSLNGEKIDLGEIGQDIYMVSAKNDHITPWTGCFKPLHNMKGKVDFVLGNSGHVAGVANPPSNTKSYFWSAPIKGADAEKWLEGAKRIDGSWWPNWKDWIQARAGEKVAPRDPVKNKKYKPIEPAPGSYVKEKS